MTNGTPRLHLKDITKPYGTAQAARLAWIIHHDRKLDRGTSLIRTCGNPRCINPLHLKEAEAEDLWDDPEMPRKRQGSVGALRLGKLVVDAQRVYQIQSLPPPRDPRLGLRAAFHWDVCWPAPHDAPPSYHSRQKLEIIRAIRRCPIRASRTVLPCGFIRYDLPPGITEIAFDALPPPVWEPLVALDDDDGPEEAPKAHWAIAA